MKDYLGCSVERVDPWVLRAARRLGVEEERRVVGKDGSAVVLAVSPEALARDPCVEHWLSRLPDSRRVYLGNLRRFMVWLRSQPGWECATPRQLIQFQDNVATKEQRYTILNLVQGYVSDLPAKRFKSRQLAYSTVLSFFAYNRSELPHDPHFRVRGEEAPVTGRLTVDDARRLIAAAKPRERSTITLKWMAFLDNKGLEYAGTALARDIVSQIKARKEIVILNMPGRKHDENRRSFCTMFGKDAIVELTQYFERYRPGGWPKGNEPLWYNQFGLPISSTGFAERFMALGRRIGLVPQEVGDASTRYGYNSHELRDAARTLLHVAARAKGFDLDVAEFMMGHTSKLDPSKYDKFIDDRNYMIDQYRIAEPFLNIVSNPAALSGPRPKITLQDLADLIHEDPKKIVQALNLLPDDDEEELEKK